MGGYVKKGGLPPHLSWPAGRLGFVRACVLFVVMLITASVGLPAGIAGAQTTTWSVLAAPNHLSRSGLFEGIACPSIGMCISVGETPQTTSRFLTLAEQWNGTDWKVQSTANPAKISAQLNGIDCVSTTSCAAVGFSQNLPSGGGGGGGIAQQGVLEPGHFGRLPNGQAPSRQVPLTLVPNAGASGSAIPLKFTLAEIWNGRSWTMQATPNPQAAYSQLNGISCVTSTNCIAVGSSTTNLGATTTLAEAWNGTTWSIVATPNPAGATSSQLNGVACASSQTCIAVGSSTGASGSVTLAETWNGTTWAVVTTPNPAGASSSQLNGLACHAAASCMAVGSSTDASGTTTTLGETWDGITWAIDTTANKTGSSYSELLAISCTSATSCIATGDALHSTSDVVPLVEAFNSPSWTLESVDVSAGAVDTYLAAVSCPEATACTAVGDSSETLLSEFWNGTRWKHVLTSPLAQTSNTLAAVSCPTATACTEVGTYLESPSDSQALIDSWNGSAWTMTASTVINSNLAGVSCTSPGVCMAVGDRIRGSGTIVAFAESGNGAGWNELNIPNPTGATDTELSSVACSSASSCTAVGFSDKAGTTVALAEAWDGSVWTIETVANPSRATNTRLSGISCRTSNSCMAVGFSSSGAGTDVPLAESWDGISWTIDSVPSPSDSNFAELSGISCSAATRCMAVGSYFSTTSDTTVPLVETWNGTSWTPHAAVDLAGSPDTQLVGVSCTAASACTAAGSYTDALGYLAPLVETWDGTAWTIQTVPIPQGDLYSEFTGVACPGASACMASGFYHFGNINTPQVLVDGTGL